MNHAKSLQYSTCFIILLFLPIVWSHGFVIEPPSRASLWRLRIPGAIVDLKDDQLYCGGFQRQWNFNNGQCGPCGDDFSLSKPRPYENMGGNTRGIVAKTYQEGSVIHVTVTLTDNHKGYFLFHVCKLKRDDDIEDEKCFAKYPLKLASSGGYRYQLDSWRPGNYTVKLQLPEGLICDRCVLRWHYTAGNSWGKCANGTQALGCGPQETLRTCSDIAITAAESGFSIKLPKLSGFGHKLALYLGSKRRDIISERSDLDEEDDSLPEPLFMANSTK